MDQNDNLLSSDVPIGFGLALMANQSAYKRFAEMRNEQKKQILQGCRGIKNKDEMKKYIDDIAKSMI